MRALSVLAILLSSLGRAPGADGGPIYGIHDFEPRPDGFLGVLEAGGVRGWVTATEAVGTNPADRSGKDYTPVSSRGHTVIVRLNNGYGSSGTIPLKARWADFAARCANFAAASQGASIWVIGNETNLWGEWPADALLLLRVLFLGEAPPAGLGTCGIDGTADSLGTCPPARC